MEKTYLSVLPLVLVLCGCQQGAQTQHAEPSVAASATLAPSEAMAPVSAAAAAQPVPADQPARTGQPAPVARTTAPKPAGAVPVVAKPEVKAAAVLSDTEGRKLAQTSGCFACHAIDKRMVGPAWREVASKYRGQAGAEASLIEKVAKGSRGVWGSTPMPPNARVSAADTRALVRFILSLK